ncbi:nickel transport protein [[Luteovulum] sphaeroides subsp. megalophilum]|uniref:cobalamin biosynthesis protein CbiL n=1 Tax=Cereibacter sphaeroides TaxID=1063 RepID=UPI000B693F23|nr:cobalamin biosynthesis protein CbiL [Cereibacter sphaeroides]SNS90528.1 nickel transport protein [[Luteovulum] sphaeroides subsp. megalophilum]
MRRALLLLLALLLAGPAAAHSLRLFAKVEGRKVSGYGFFVGGGRPRGADWSARMAGLPLAQGETDAEGGFRFEVPEAVTGDVVIALDTGEGHMARVTLPPERFGGVPVPSGAIPLKAGGPALPAAEEPPSAPAPTENSPSAPAPTKEPLSALSPTKEALAPTEDAPSPEVLRAIVSQAVEAEVAPLLERIEQMDARMRVTDIVSGLFLIFGGAGIALWARGRRR